MKKMRKKTKKISKPARNQLQYLIEEFLEKSGTDITAKIGVHGGAAKTMWEQLEGILFADTFWMDEVDPEDKTKIGYEKLLKEYHAFLKPIWDQFRDALFDYKYGIIPDREQLHRSRKNIDRDKASAFSEFRSLLKGDTVIDWEKLKADLEGLHMDHLKQVLRLVEIMMMVKEEDEKLLKSHRNQ